jgi:uncharacterized cupin superfamily protein
MTHAIPELTELDRTVNGHDLRLRLSAMTEDVVEGNPTIGDAALGALGGVEVGVWEITTGVVDDTEVDELFVVLSGSARVEFLDEGRSVELRQGSIGRLRAGQRTRWHINEPLRKVYVLTPAAAG